MITFNHSGNLGDILYSLYFCKEFSEAHKFKQFNLNLQINVPDGDAKLNNHPFGAVRLTKDAAMFIKPLLESQPYIHNVFINENIPEGSFVLDNFRRLRINFFSGDLRSWYYNLTGDILPREFWKPILTTKPNKKYQDKIILIATERYQNPFIDYKCLQQFKDKIIFMGLPNEYNIFCTKYFSIDFCKVNSLEEAAQYMAGCKCVIGNPSGLYSVAECLKVPRILVQPEFMSYQNSITRGPVNVHPLGGNNTAVSTTEKLLYTVNNI